MIDRKRIKALTRFYFRLDLHKRGQRFPDARDDELKDRGAHLEWRQNVARNLLQRRRVA